MEIEMKHTGKLADCVKCLPLPPPIGDDPFLFFVFS